MEREIEKYLVGRVKAMGGVCWKWTGTTGAPDRICIFPDGVIKLVEVKQANGRLSPIQKVVHKTLAKLGVEVSVVWSKADVDAILDQ